MCISDYSKNASYSDLYFRIIILFPAVPGTVKDLAKIGLGRVVNGSIHQSIWWNKPAHHTSLLHYNISYALEDGVVYKTTNGTTFNLTFNLPTQMESYDVQVAVAVVSNAGQGEYKNITIEYKSEYLKKMINLYGCDPA